MPISKEMVLLHPHIFGNALGMDRLTKLHSDWIKKVILSGKSKNLQAHRGSYKTTAITVLGAIIYATFNPDGRMFIFRKEFSENIKPIFREIKKYIESEVYQQLTAQLLGAPVTIVRATDNTIELSHRKKTVREANITGFSIGSSVTGQHCDFILNDDISTLKDRVSKAERERTKIIYNEQKNIIDPGKPVCTVGTPWHPDDVFSICGDIIKYDINSTGLKAFTKSHINSLKESMPPSLYAANYELKHIAAEDRLFTDINYAEWDYTIQPVGHIDAKYSGKDTGAFTMIGRKPDGTYQAVGFMFTDNIQDCLKSIKRLWAKYKCGTIYKEKNDDKGYTAIELRKMGIPAHSYHEKENKHVKIVQHLYPHWNKIQWSHESDSNYLNQVLEYAEGIGHDDCADSAASLMRQLISSGVTGKIKLKGI